MGLRDVLHQRAWTPLDADQKRHLWVKPHRPLRPRDRTCRTLNVAKALERVSIHGRICHDLVLRAACARASRFTPTKAGEYHFHCDVDSHAKKGMMGMLVVVEP